MSRGGGGLAAGLATFNSCNKAGSIPHFTRHLQSHPKDYNALMWRGRAHSIVGNMESARVDFQAAGINSSGPRRYVAQYFEASVSNEGEKSMKLLSEALSNYPESQEVLGEIGTVFFMSNQYSTALPILEKTVSIIERGGRIEEPSYCWHQHNIGSIYLENKQLDAAERAFAAALNFSETHTVSHIGYAQVQLAKGKDAVARRHYDRARVLNPTLVTWTTFEAFKTAVQPAQPATWYETFMNLPKTLGNMALSVIGMSGSTQNGQASVQTTARPATSASTRTPSQPGTSRNAFSSPVQSGNAVSAPRNTFTSPTQTSTRAKSAVSPLRTSANQPIYNAGTDKSTSRTVSKNYYSSYGISANQSTFTSSSDNAVLRPSSSRSTKSTSNSKAGTGNSAERSNGSQFGSRQSTSRPYSSAETYRSHSRPSSAPLLSHSNPPISTGATRSSHLNTTPRNQPGRFYPLLPDDELNQAGEPIISTNQVTWDEGNNLTVEAAKNSRSSRNNVNKSNTGRSSGTRNSSGDSRGQGNGSGNGGDGGGSDDEDNESNEEWKKMRKESREILKYGGKEYVLSKDEKYYYSRDKAGHGHVKTPFLKIYANKKNRLDFVGSLDRNLELMEDKHESREGTSIRKADMDVVRRR